METPLKCDFEYLVKMQLGLGRNKDQYDPKSRFHMGIWYD